MPGAAPPPQTVVVVQAGSKWYESVLIIVLALFCCWPLGLILTWTNRQWTTKTKWVVTAIIAVLVLGGIGVAVATSSSTKTTVGSNSSSTGNGGSSNSGGNDSSTASGVGTSAASPAPVGTSVTVAKGWDVKVNSAELDADATMKSANEFNTPSAGKQFVLVNVTVTNNMSTPEMAMTNIKLSLLPSSGVAVDSFSCFATEPNPLDLTAQMQPGATATGNICYEVAPADAATSVLLGEPQLTLDTNKDQRFFALK